MQKNELYYKIKQLTKDKFNMYLHKIDTFLLEGRSEIEIYNLICRYIAVKQFCRTLDFENGNYIDFVKSINIATFLESKFNTDKDIAIMNKTLIYEDDCICIFKPTSFQESEVIGEEICCFAFSQGRWDEHYIENHESIYYVYDVMRKGTLEDFVAITVRPNGRALVLDKEHNWWSKEESIRYINGLGDGAKCITTQNGKQIKSENKQYNMKTNRIRLTESQLHNVIKKSVKRVLRESSDEERINAAVEALMSVRDVVSAAARKCGFKMGSKTALEKAIINANNAIEAVFGFSNYGDELRVQRDIEQYEQD